MAMSHAALLDDANRGHFYIGAVTVGPKRSQKSQKVKDRAQEWHNLAFNSTHGIVGEKVYRIRVRIDFAAFPSHLSMFCSYPVFLLIHPMHNYRKSCFKKKSSFYNK